MLKPFTPGPLAEPPAVPGTSAWEALQMRETANRWMCHPRVAWAEGWSRRDGDLAKVPGWQLSGSYN